MLNSFADVLAASQLPGSLDLMVTILDTLTKLVHDVPATSADKVFAEQLLLSALENAANNMAVSLCITRYSTQLNFEPQADTKVPAASLRLDILVELIRGMGSTHLSLLLS